jgi:hypothetical protein
MTQHEPQSNTLIDEHFCICGHHENYHGLVKDRLCLYPTILPTKLECYCKCRGFKGVLKQ